MASLFTRRGGGGGSEVLAAVGGAQDEKLRRVSIAASVTGGGGAMGDDDVCVVTHEYAARGPSELTIRPGDIVVVVARRGMWWYGESTAGAAGYFPAALVQVCISECALHATCAYPNARPM